MDLKGYYGSLKVKCLVYERKNIFDEFYKYQELLNDSFQLKEFSYMKTSKG